MRCIICDGNDWESVDEHRFKNEGMMICKICSFVSYPSKWKSEEEIKKYYRDDYRPGPGVGNLLSGQRKLHFHNKFLTPLFKEWKEKDIKEPEIFEIGAAYGMALAWIRDSYKGAKVGGTELTTSYKRNAFYEYGIELTDDFDDSKKYDLIMSYKVAEHQLDADKHLIKYRSCLKENGYMYISVPCWFDKLYLFGEPGFDVERYYHPNHINVWSRKLFESLLKKVGLEIIREDHLMYDSTYLVKACEPKELTQYDYESVDRKKIEMNAIKLSYIAFLDNRFSDAILLYKKYPLAHVSLIEIERQKANKMGWDLLKQTYLDKMFYDCGECFEFYDCASDFALRYNKFEEAIKYTEKALEIKPENPTSLERLINIMREIALRSKTQEQRFHYFNQARLISRHLREVSLEAMYSAVDKIYQFNSELPLPEKIKQN